MRQTVAKHLRKMAAHEMANDNVPARKLEGTRFGVINSPHSVRAMYLAMKNKFKSMKSATITPPKTLETRQRKASTFHRPQDLTTFPALIQRPLRLLARLFPGTTDAATGEYTPSKIVAFAKSYADCGQGAAVAFMANSYSNHQPA